MKIRHLLVLLMVLCVPGIAIGQGKKPAKTMTSKSKTHKMPARDPKTGRFMKSAKAPKTMKMGKKMPARDPKTGRFIKSKP